MSLMKNFLEFGIFKSPVTEGFVNGSEASLDTPMGASPRPWAGHSAPSNFLYAGPT